MVNDIYVHYVNGKRYQVILLGKIQIDNVWVTAVTYKEVDLAEGVYTRSLAEFEVKFKKVER